MNRAGFGCDSMHRQGWRQLEDGSTFIRSRGQQLLRCTMDGEAERVLQRVAQ